MLFSAKNHSVYHNKFYPRNDYYVIDSNEPVLEFINMSNSSSGFKSVNTYDFSTLYHSAGKRDRDLTPSPAIMLDGPKGREPR